MSRLYQVIHFMIKQKGLLPEKTKKGQDVALRHCPCRVIKWEERISAMRSRRASLERIWSHLPLQAFLSLPTLVSACWKLGGRKKMQGEGDPTYTEINAPLPRLL